MVIFNSYVTNYQRVTILKHLLYDFVFFVAQSDRHHDSLVGILRMASPAPKNGKVSSPVEFPRNLWMIILGVLAEIRKKKHMSSGENYIYTYNIYIYIFMYVKMCR